MLSRSTVTSATRVSTWFPDRKNGRAGSSARSVGSFRRPIETQPHFALESAGKEEGPFAPVRAWRDAGPWYPVAEHTAAGSQTVSAAFQAFGAAPGSSLSRTRAPRVR